MKYWGILIIVFFLFFFFSSFGTVEARSGCCSYHGGVCGCSCCDGSSLSSICAPYYPECGGDYSGYTPQPSCPLMSTHNGSTGQCECMTGYVASGSICISTSQMCTNKYGYNAEYDYLNNNCKCRYGYVWNSSSTACISQDEACQSQYGFSSKATISGDKCDCRYGYTFNRARTRCITSDAACQEINGLMSQSDLNSGCKCLYGFEYDGSQCVPASNGNSVGSYPTDTTVNNGVVPVSVSPILTPSETKTKSIKKIPPTVTLSTTSSPSASPSISSTPTLNNHQPNRIADFFSRFFSWLFGKNK